MGLVADERADPPDLVARRRSNVEHVEVGPQGLAKILERRGVIENPDAAAVGGEDQRSPLIAVHVCPKSVVLNT